jgi:hypothetical protein
MGQVTSESLRKPVQEGRFAMTLSDCYPKGCLLFEPALPALVPRKFAFATPGTTAGMTASDCAISKRESHNKAGPGRRWPNPAKKINDEPARSRQLYLDAALALN